MVKGIKDADAKMWALPAAFQAHAKDVPPNGDGVQSNGKYIGIL